jgi:hypothetical protein
MGRVHPGSGREVELEGRSLRLVPRWGPESWDFFASAPQEGRGVALVMMQALIDLNPVQESLVFEFAFDG